jgi:hypothetical protein
MLIAVDLGGIETCAFQRIGPTLKARFSRKKQGSILAQDGVTIQR